ncbi:Ser/Thr protein kinase [Cryptosporidium felis]|nr:Ser/Thr protein kinase [Cryptosporidium felis]
MKDKISELNRNEKEAKTQSGLVSSFHADAPTFQPRSGLLVGMGGTAGAATTDLVSGLTATAQPFIPASIRHNIGSVPDHVDHGSVAGGFQLPSGNYSDPHINSKQGVVFSGTGTLLGAPSIEIGGSSIPEGSMGVVSGISGTDYDGMLLGDPGSGKSGTGGAPPGQKVVSGLLEDSPSGSGIHNLHYGPNGGTGSGTRSGTAGIPGGAAGGGSGIPGFQGLNLNSAESGSAYYGDSNAHPVIQTQPVLGTEVGNGSGAGNGGSGSGGGTGSGTVNAGGTGNGGGSGATGHHHPQPNILDLSEYCRRVRGWNLPFLRTVPQMNAITQIRHELQLQNISLLLTQNDINSSGGTGGAICQHYVPPIVHRVFYGLCLLDDSNVASTTRFCGFQTYAYKAINAEDYSAYCLRRIDGFPIAEFEVVRPLLERWQRIAQHPCIVSYRQSFVSLDFPQASLFAVYDYIPNASTMESVHFKEPIGEPLLWNYIIQIVLALVHIHSSQLAARVIDPTKLLISYRGRLRLNCVGILDLTRVDESKTILDYQKQDLVALGYIILALCCGSLTIINDLNHAVEQIFLKSSLYSNDLKKLVLILLSKPALNKNNLDVFILANMLAARMIPQIEHSLKLTDALENEFRKEIDNGRLFRLLTKINTIADRTQLNAIHKWNETGDRYICKLFREYLFQQTDSQGRPVIDMGHILDSLAKVDVGTSETITLMSSDGSSIILVSFADIKQSIEKSFCEIVAATTSSSSFNDL